MSSATDNLCAQTEVLIYYSEPFIYLPFGQREPHLFCGGHNCSSPQRNPFHQPALGTSISGWRITMSHVSVDCDKTYK